MITFGAAVIEHLDFTPEQELEIEKFANKIDKLFPLGTVNPATPAEVIGIMHALIDPL